MNAPLARHTTNNIHMKNTTNNIQTKIENANMIFIYLFHFISNDKREKKMCKTVRAFAQLLIASKAEINVFRHFYISLKISIAHKWPEGWKQGGHVFGFCIPSNKSRLGIPKLWIWNYFHRVRHDFTNQNNPKYVVLTMHSEKPKRFEFDSSWHPSDATSLLIDYLL